ncbi:hypothetical protein Avbf_10922 [Armadillidium vulgare]|nr:hypothetical protein Avbf_10922 [Armadillidium vulgare]
MGFFEIHPAYAVIWEIESGKVWSLSLPHGVRNISTQVLQSTSCVLSRGFKYAVAGVSSYLLKECDFLSNLILMTYFKFSIQLNNRIYIVKKFVRLGFGNLRTCEGFGCSFWSNYWNGISHLWAMELDNTYSLDRTVKVWNINNIFEQVHVIDRHELQVDSIVNF